MSFINNCLRTQAYCIKWNIPVDVPEKRKNKLLTSVSCFIAQWLMFIYKSAYSLLFLFVLVFMPRCKSPDFRKTYSGRQYSVLLCLKATGYRLWQTCVQTPGLPIMSCVNLGKLINLSEFSAFSFEKLQGLLWGLNELICVKCLAK